MAAASIGAAAATAAERSTARCRVSAPIVRPPLTLMPANSADVVDVDQHRGSGQTQRKHGQQALATGQDLCVVAVLGQQLNGLLHGFRSSIVEWR